jgi:hypothetical protein
MPTTHHTLQREAPARTIFAPSVHWKAALNASRLLRGPFTRQYGGEAGIIKIFRNVVHGRIFGQARNPRHPLLALT